MCRGPIRIFRHWPRHLSRIRSNKGVKEGRNSVVPAALGIHWKEGHSKLIRRAGLYTMIIMEYNRLVDNLETLISHQEVISNKCYNKTK
jgi:hypothetical protein